MRTRLEKRNRAFTDEKTLEVAGLLPDKGWAKQEHHHGAGRVHEARVFKACRQTQQVNKPEQRPNQNSNQGEHSLWARFSITFCLQRQLAVLSRIHSSSHHLRTVVPNIVDLRI